MVSIVLPVYNGARFLSESIKSVLAQTYMNWELIIVDDCSTDASLEIAYKFAQKDKRIKVIHNRTNMKLTQSLNIGFKESKGNLLLWTSDDNLFLPNAIEVMQKYLGEHEQAYMVAADMVLMNYDGKEKGKVDCICSNLCASNCVGACFMYRRTVYDIVGEYDVKLFGVEDYDYWLRVEQRFGKIHHIPQKLYQYRIHEGSLTATKQELINEKLMQLREKHWKYILASVRGDKEAIYCLYYDSVMRLYNEKIIHTIENFFPDEGLGKGDIWSNKRCVIFGAGKYGEMAAKLLGEKAYCFVDNDEIKVGKMKMGFMIESSGKLKKLAEDFNIMIAVHAKYVYQIMQQLINSGIEKYCTYQSYYRFCIDRHETESR